jgi:radical SAM superfamily enzyme YgiQ (UPF0313 family)
MRVLLIAPASGRWHRVGRSGLFRGRTFRFSLLSLLSVAAATPEGIQVRIADEQVEDIPWDGPWDLVGITCMTATAPRAYEVAARFRSRGVPVVLGGMHPTFMAEEALRHADAVVVGDAEEIWPHVVKKAAAGCLTGIYRAAVPPDLKGLAPPPRHLLLDRHYASIEAVQATRGCPHACSFCSVSAFHSASQRCRPVSEVVAEVASLPGRFLVFVDDNLTADKKYARDLFEALKPLRKVWISQASLEITDEPDLVTLASDSGCIGLFVGLETFGGGNLDSVQKGFHREREYRERLAILHSRGIGVEAGVVFGFDGDGPRAFSSTLRLLDDLEVDMAQISILTPMPGTPQHAAMSSRIFDWDWSHYDYHHAVFAPARISAEQLQAGHDWVTREFYRPWRIARRLARMARRPRGFRAIPFAAALNIAYAGRIGRWGIRGWDPEKSSGELCGVRVPCEMRSVHP